MNEKSTLDSAALRHYDVYEYTLNWRGIEVDAWFTNPRHSRERARGLHIHITSFFSRLIFSSYPLRYGLFTRQKSKKNHQVVRGRVTFCITSFFRLPIGRVAPGSQNVVHDSPVVHHSSQHAPPSLSLARPIQLHTSRHGLRSQYPSPHLRRAHDGQHDGGQYA